MEQRLMVRGRVYAADDPDLQAALATIYRTNERPFCMCRPEGVPMAIALYSTFVVKRMPDSGPRHHPSCPSYEPPPSHSGLGALIGDAVQERDAGRTELRLDFPLARYRSVARAAPAGGGGGVGDVVVARKGLSLGGLTQLLWERAGLNRWYPAMRGKRNWALVHRLVQRAVANIDAKGACGLDWAYVPEPFSSDRKDEILLARKSALRRLASPRDDAQYRMMVLIAPLKDVSATTAGTRKIVLKHMPDVPLLMEEEAWKRFARSFQGQIEARDIDADLHLMLAALAFERRESIYQIERASALLLTEDWIPVFSYAEALFCRQLVQQQRAFIKPLPYELKRPQSIPNFLLLDAGDEPITLDLVPPDDADKARCARERAEAGGWCWHTAEPMPALPPATVRGRSAAHKPKEQTRSTDVATTA